MNKQDFQVYFELYGKKMKTTVAAVSANQAIEIVKSKIIFHNVKPEDPMENIFKQFEDIFKPDK